MTLERKRTGGQTTSITVYGGAGQIGGNKILVEHKDTRLFLDFGEPFKLKDDFFVDWLMPRDRFGLRDYFFFDLLPKIDGLYDEEQLEGTGVRYTRPAFDAIIVSHMHFDHAMHLKFADRNIPVHLGSAADIIRESWEYTGGKNVDFGEHKFNRFRTGDRFRVGSIEVEPIHVDHSVPGAYAFLLHTPEGCIAYTGDLRMHGTRGDLTADFVRRAAEEKPIALISEGTRVTDKDPRKNISEKGVEERCRRLISSNRKLAIVSFYPKDVDRMRTFRDVAVATGRKFVVSAKVAHLLEALKADKHISVPDPMCDPNMLVYVRQMARPLAYEHDYIDRRNSSDHIVDSEFVNKNQRGLIYHTDFMQLTELIDVKPERGSLFIRSKSEPFEEDDAQEEVLKHWIKFLGLDFHTAHASGHASMQEIFSMVKAIRPKVLIPVHTEFPELFKRCSDCVQCPELRKTVPIA